jgi:hypothetical protein
MLPQGLTNPRLTRSWPPVGDVTNAVPDPLPAFERRVLVTAGCGESERSLAFEKISVPVQVVLRGNSISNASEAKKIASFSGARQEMSECAVGLAGLSKDRLRSRWAVTSTIAQ